MAYRNALGFLRAVIGRPSYRQYLKDKLRRRTGYRSEQWIRVVYSHEWQRLFASMPLQSLSVLEISPGPLPVLQESSVGHYQAVNFPEFDITRDVLSEQFDLIIAEHVFEHLRHPYRAAHNVHKMLRDDGLFLIATPFMIKIHGHPHDYTRWTPDGLRAFLEDCDFTAEVHAWGNRKAVRANFESWREYGRKRDLRNEAEFPASVWAYARKRLANNGSDEGTPRQSSGAASQSHLNRSALTASEDDVVASRRGRRVMPARISVIIPTHNRAAMLPRAIESAQNAGTDLEVIVVDDASFDETQSICVDRKDIIYLRMQRNVGQADARNAGFSRSTGEFVAFLDDDDLRLPGSLDMQAKLLECEENLGFVYGQVHIGDTETCRPTEEIRPKYCPAGDIFWQLVRGNFIYCPSVLVRRSKMEAIGPFSSEVLGTEDWDAWLRLAAISRVGAVQQPVAIYRDFSRASGQTSSNRPKMCLSSARTQARALCSPRAAAAPQGMRQEIRSQFIDLLWKDLVEQGDKALSDHDIRTAVVNYLTAIRLHPRRAARLGAIRNLTRFIHAQSR